VPPSGVSGGGRTSIVDLSGVRWRVGPAAVCLTLPQHRPSETQYSRSYLTARPDPVGASDAGRVALVSSRVSAVERVRKGSHVVYPRGTELEAGSHCARSGQTAPPTRRVTTAEPSSGVRTRQRQHTLLAGRMGGTLRALAGWRPPDRIGKVRDVAAWLATVAQWMVRLGHCLGMGCALP
jgi:hypothetical protein